MYGIKCDNKITLKVHSEYGHTVNIRATSLSGEPASNSFKYPTVAAGKVTIHEPGLYGVKCDSHLTQKVHSEYGHTVNIKVTKK
ncbi:MAG: hypothetical protein ISR69_03635 [Gammaproteobacteria bacterium]|nr:hypothetical protein [Gammaproteobacteria bacterium]